MWEEAWGRAGSQRGSSIKVGCIREPGGKPGRNAASITRKADARGCGTPAVDLMRALNSTEAHCHCHSAMGLPDAMSICGGKDDSGGGGDLS